MSTSQGPATLSRPDVAAAEAATRRLALGHYENFSVVSFLLPAHLRQDFCNVYAFCRTADDLADEIGDRDESLRLLADFRRQLHDCFAGRPADGLYVALRQTIDRHALPIQPFDDLIDAFEQDQRVSRYRTFADVVDYCRRSADPVGRLVLWMCGYRDAHRQRLSDRTCTALQLANFWQDVRRDLLERDRIYLPAETMDRFGMNEPALRALIDAGTCDDRYRRMLRFEVDRTADAFDEGDALLPMLDRSVRGQISLFSAGGRAVLESIRRRNYDTTSGRPALSKLQKGRLVAAALFGRLTMALHAWPASTALPAEVKA